jgi:hypothetical protein
MRVLQLNPDYEPLWRSLANAVFRVRTGMDFGYGYRGKVDDSNADAVLGKHATPEHVAQLAQLALARVLRASAIKAAHAEAGPTAPPDAFLDRLVTWYGAVAAHTYGSGSRYHKPDKKRARELAAEAGEMLDFAARGIEQHEDDEQREIALLGGSTKRLAAAVLAATGLRCVVLEAAESDIKWKRTPAGQEEEEEEDAADRPAWVEDDPPALDANVGRRPRNFPHLSEELHARAANETRGGADVVVIRCAEEAFFVVAVPDSTAAWTNRPAALDMILGALRSRVHPVRTAAVFAVPVDIAEYLAAEVKEKTGGAGAGSAAGSAAGSGSSEATGSSDHHKKHATVTSEVANMEAGQEEGTEAAEGAEEVTEAAAQEDASSLRLG